VTFSLTRTPLASRTAFLFDAPVLPVDHCGALEADALVPDWGRPLRRCVRKSMLTGFVTLLIVRSSVTRSVRPVTGSALPVTVRAERRGASRLLGIGGITIRVDPRA
jgi:hypothetical protein